MKMKNKKNEPEDLQLHVKQGEIKPTEHYKYLGDVYDTKASNVEKIKNRMQKISYIANEVKQQGSYQKVGNCDAQVRKTLIETTVILPWLTQKHGQK